MQRVERGATVCRELSMLLTGMQLIYGVSEICPHAAQEHGICLEAAQVRGSVFAMAGWSGCDYAGCS